MFGWRKRKVRSGDTPADHPSAPETLRCSFCNKAQADVRKLIAGPAVFICDECVDVCVDIIADDLQIRPRVSARDPEPQRVARSRAQDTVGCSLCGKPASLSEMLPIGNLGLLCGTCADAVEDALAQGRPAS